MTVSLSELFFHLFGTTHSKTAAGAVRKGPEESSLISSLMDVHGSARIF
jgi:hypothetical protein